MDFKQVSRRNFIRNGLIASEAVAFTLWGGPQVLAGAQPLITGKPKSGKTYKVGIIGCGNRSKAHIGSLNNVSEIEIGALCDVVPHKMDQRAELIKKGPKPRKYTDIDQMLKQDDLDAVAIVLPNHLHKMAAVASLEAGKHVFCEKPMALTVADCNVMLAAAEKARKAIQIGTQRRHASGYQKMVETIRNASLGDILSSDMNTCRGDWRVPDADEYPAGVPYWRMVQEQCGGVVYEMGAHLIDVNNWIFNSEPVTVVSLQGVNNHALRQRDSYDHAGVLVRYANDALMNYDGNLYNYGGGVTNQIFAVNGSVQMKDSGQIEIIYGHAKGVASSERLPKPIKVDVPGGDGTTEQWNYFAKVLAGQADPYPNGHDGRQSIQICQGSVVSARERTVVNVKDLDSI